MHKRDRKRRKGAFAAALMLLLAAALLGGCSLREAGRGADERIQIKVQYMCGRMNLDLESVLEERFPQVDIVTDELVGVPDYVISR